MKSFSARQLSGPGLGTPSRLTALSPLAISTSQRHGFARYFSAEDPTLVLVPILSPRVQAPNPSAASAHWPLDLSRPPAKLLTSSLPPLWSPLASQMAAQSCLRTFALAVPEAWNPSPLHAPKVPCFLSKCQLKPAPPSMPLDFHFP